MALSNMVFTNDKGSFTLSRVMYSISHRFVWDGAGPAKHVSSITVNGVLMTDESNIEDIAGEGGIGTLALPNKTYNNMYIREASHENGIWAKWGRVTVVFDDDNGDINDYVIHWRGFALYNPTVSIEPSTIKRAETAIFGMSGWQRQQLGHQVFNISVTGTAITPSGYLPSGLVESMERTDATSLYPSDYPEIFDFNVAIPEASGNLDIEKCMVTDGQVKWNFEDNYADVTITIVAPPQTW